MAIDRIHLILGLVWLLAGMALGEMMGRSQDHTQMPTHAHIMLVGGVLSITWAVIYKLWKIALGFLALIQTALHHLGALAMNVLLYLYYGGQMTVEQAGPFLGISAGLLMISVVLMLVQAFRARD
jgi:hypothetical protein